MVRIPTPETQGAQPIGNVQLDTPRDAYQTVQASGWGREGAQLQEFGNALGSLGGAIAQQQQDIAMLEAQKAFSDFELELFDPNNGIMTRHGANAQGVTDEVDARLEALMSGVLGNGRLTGAARRAVEKYALGQRQRLLGKVGSHEYGEGEDYKR